MRSGEEAEEEAKKTRKMRKAEANKTEAETQAETGAETDTNDIIRSEFDELMDPTPAGAPDVASLPLFCLPNVYLFPRDTVAFNIFEPRYRHVITYFSLSSVYMFSLCSV